MKYAAIVIAVASVRILLFFGIRFAKIARPLDPDKLYIIPFKNRNMKIHDTWKKLVEIRYEKIVVIVSALIFVNIKIFFLLNLSAK